MHVRSDFVCCPRCELRRGSQLRSLGGWARGVNAGAAARLLLALVLACLLMLGGGPARAQAGAAALQSLPPASQPWLDAPALAHKLDPDFARQLARVYGELSGFPVEHDAQRAFAALWGLRCQESDSLDLERRLLEAKRHSKVQDWGLNYEAGLRFDPDTGDPDTSGNSLYAGLSWDYYRDGMWGNRLQAEMLRLEGELLAARGARSAAQRNLACRHSRAIAAFNALKLKVLASRAAFLQELHGVYRQAYFSGLVNLDEVILIERDLERTRHFMAGLGAFNASLGGPAPLLAGEPPLLDVRVEALLDAVRGDPSYQAIAGLERDIVDQRYDRRQDKRLRFYLHPRLKWDDNFDSAVDLVAGVTFSMPLSEDKREMRDVERALPALRQSQAQENDVDEMRRLYYEYKYRLDDAIKLHYQRALILERLRRAFIEQALPAGEGARLAELLQGLRDLVDTQFEVLDVKQNLYVRLLHLFSQGNPGYRPEFVSRVTEEAGMLRGRVGERALYIWAEDFNRHDNPFLIQLLKTKAIAVAVISAGHKTDAGKLAAFLGLAKGAGIRVELMVSDNEWVLPDKAAKVDAALARLFALGPNLHLDVEPHTFKDFRANRAAYLERFQRLLERVARHRGAGRSVSLALPTLVTKDEVRALSAHVDRVYVMAYGSRDPDVLLRRLEPFRQIPPERLVLALRPGDFPDELALEDCIAELARRGGIKQFALHDLAQFQSLIERSQ